MGPGEGARCDHVALMLTADQFLLQLQVLISSRIKFVNVMNIEAVTTVRMCQKLQFTISFETFA